MMNEEVKAKLKEFLKRLYKRPGLHKRVHSSVCLLDRSRPVSVREGSVLASEPAKMKI